ncbi:PleD family two-component system response regulator [Chloroflexota bacterium]
MSKEANILIIDDDPIYVKATRAVLESKKYQVSSASDGEEGCLKAKEIRPDLIILDIIMPMKDGFSTCEQLKKDPELSSIPILIMTSFADKGKETNIPTSAGFGLEADDYADKPISPDELLRRVDKLL